MPDIDTLIAWARLQTAWAPDWAFSLALIAAFAALAGLFSGVVFRVSMRLAARRDVFWAQVLATAKPRFRLFLMILAAGVASNLAPLPDGWGALLRHALLVAFILTVGWMAVGALDVASRLYLRRFDLESGDNLAARKHVTQVRILKRVAAVLIAVVTAGLAMMTIGTVRQWGVSLLASAGAAGIILGLALQPFLTNIIAGVQIAMTQPIRIDDAVVVEGEFGRIEEINGAFVVVRLWDQRRMVVPLTWFIQKPFQNWTRQASDLLGTAFIWVDYDAPISAMRAKLEEIVRASPHWDGEKVALHVTDLSERAMQVRCLASAADSGKLFDLRCEIREKMVAWLQAEHPGSLPRDRLDVDPSPARQDGERRAWN
jgi:small-conductance mechanosensitive channel